jgi:hypothetical protein
MGKSNGWPVSVVVEGNSLNLALVLHKARAEATGYYITE